MYTGGAEHSVLHLMYSRFVTMELHDWGYIDFDEPFTKFFAHGLVIKDGAKMSKSKGNVVNPDEYITLYGADALRLYLMFMGPFDQGGDFRDTAMEGMSRWVGRVWKMVLQSQESQAKTSPEIGSLLQKLIGKVTEDLEKRRYNTAIASMMEFTNAVAADTGVIHTDDAKAFIQLLAPFAPHVTEELWCLLNGLNANSYTQDQSIHTSSWPTADTSRILSSSVTVIVQINGKVRDMLELSPDSSKNQTEVEKTAKESAKVQSHLDGKTIRKVIFVPGKIVNFVV
jgi:leucyl-tRNA synthetase